jgi:hypothetical protein
LLPEDHRRDLIGAWLSAPTEVCPPAIRFIGDQTNEGTMHMIVIGVDAHKGTHTCAAVQELTGRELQTRTVPARDDGHGRLLEWARALGEQVVWAIEDCEGVSSSV